MLQDLFALAVASSFPSKLPFIAAIVISACVLLIAVAAAGHRSEVR